MKRYAMSFRRFKDNCIYKTDKHRTKIKTKYACRKKLNMDWIAKELPARHIECRENKCPVVSKCRLVSV